MGGQGAGGCVGRKSISSNHYYRRQCFLLTPIIRLTGCGGFFGNLKISRPARNSASFARNHESNSAFRFSSSHNSNASRTCLLAFCAAARWASIASCKVIRDPESKNWVNFSSDTRKFSRGDAAETNPPDRLAVLGGLPA